MYIYKYDRQETLFFCDPPYWKTEGYGVAFPLEEYTSLAETMRAIKGKAILTINDHPQMVKVFAGFRIEKVKINYTVGGADKVKLSQEMIVMNW